MWFDAETVRRLRHLRSRILTGLLNEDGPRIPVWKALKECEDSMEVYSQLDDPGLRWSGRSGHGSVTCSVCDRFSGRNPCNSCFRSLSEGWPASCVVCLDKKGNCFCSDRLQ